MKSIGHYGLATQRKVKDRKYGFSIAEICGHFYLGCCNEYIKVHNGTGTIEKKRIKKNHIFKD